MAFTPMRTYKSAVYLANNAGGFDVRACPQANELAQFIKTACNRHALFVKAAKAAVAYDDAISRCMNDPEAMSSFCTAQGDDLDALYAQWIRFSRDALADLAE